MSQDETGALHVENYDEDVNLERQWDLGGFEGDCAWICAFVPKCVIYCVLTPNNSKKMTETEGWSQEEGRLFDTDIITNASQQIHCL